MVLSLAGTVASAAASVVNRLGHTGLAYGLLTVGGVLIGVSLVLAFRVDRQERR